MHDDPIIVKIQKQRFFLVFLGSMLAYIFIAGYYLDFQANLSDECRARAFNNRTQVIRLQAPRGRIYDRNRILLVDNRPSYCLSFPKNMDKKLRKELAESLAELLHIDKKEFLTDMKVAYEQQVGPDILVYQDLSQEHLAIFAKYKALYPQVKIKAIQVRDYLYDDLACHLLGYMGPVSDAELKLPIYAQKGVLPGDYVGKSGLERYFEHYLIGTDGFKTLEVDALGHVIEEMGYPHYKNPIPGEDLYLTIDYRLQRIIEDVFDCNAGGVVAMDPNNGEVLAIYSRPTFNPNMLIGKQRKNYFKSLLADKKNPLYNRCVQSAQPIGSIFKTVTALAALESGVIHRKSTFKCEGKIYLRRTWFSCFRNEAHGELTVRDALKHSCNVSFVQIGDKLELEDLLYTARELGFGQPTGIEIHGEKAGLVSNPEDFAKMGKIWRPAEQLFLSIGQGGFLATPIQVAVAISAIANGRYRFSPRLLLKPHSSKDDNGIHELSFDQRNIELVREGMYAVANEEGGTAYWVRVKGLNICGKTGTAQVVGNDFDWSKVKDSFDRWQKQDHGWFACFADYDAPEIVLVIYIEHGGKKAMGKRIIIAREIMRRYFNEIKSQDG